MWISPVPGTKQTSYYLGDSGKLSTIRPNGNGSQPDALINIGFTGSIYVGYWMDVPELFGASDIPISKRVKLFKIPFTERDYVSEPLAADMTIMGTPMATYYYQNSGPFTQLDSTLYEVTPEGRDILVSRGAYEGYNPSAWSNNNTASNPIEMQACYHRFQAGSRIKLEVATASLIDILPVWGINLILLHHKQQMSSSLNLPVVPDTY